MTKTFTPNDVLRYLYKETNSTENKELEDAMHLHSDLLDEYVQLAGIKEQLDQVRKSPSKRTVQAILQYSDSHNPILS
jgi:hypothetical protein